jgi:PPK2 family polyphosphate:nucleotide phosphotransferase
MPPQTSDPRPAPGGSRHRVDPGEPFRITDHHTSATGPYGSEGEAAPVLDDLRGRLAELADRLGAEGEHALLVVLQGFDGAGKDHVIAHVLGAIDPSLLHVFSFNTPVGDEVDHDFLWRFHQQTPARGRVHAFDRSYYEEVIGARVHEVVTEDACRARYDSINDFERLLARDGTVIAKFFLHVDKEVQAERVRERLHERSKQHEFSAADVEDRDQWDEYDRAYEDAIDATGTDVAPWHVIPADERWYACVAVAEALVSALEDLDPQYPPLDEDEVREAGLDPGELQTG